MFSEEKRRTAPSLLFRFSRGSLSTTSEYKRYPAPRKSIFVPMRLNAFFARFGRGLCLCFRTVLFDDDIYLKGQGYGATMEARKWLETSEEFTQVRKFKDDPPLQRKSTLKQASMNADFRKN